MLLYKKSSIFNAPSGFILAHACNCHGVWGSGIAKEFKDRFPESFKEYNNRCNSWDGLLGTTFITREGIACLFTSNGYGPTLDSEKSILDNTDKALGDFFRQLPEGELVYSNKFNSGLFRVPWEKTEKILKKHLKKNPSILWIVCDSDL